MGRRAAIVVIRRLATVALGLLLVLVLALSLALSRVNAAVMSRASTSSCCGRLPIALVAAIAVAIGVLGRRQWWSRAV